MQCLAVFSSKGTVGRLCFLLSIIFYVVSVPLGFAACLLIRLLADPIVYIWSESAARFVSDYLLWFATGWRPILAVVAFYLIADRIFSCAYIKRARAIGVEIPNTWVVYYCFMGFEPGATVKDMLLTPGKKALPGSGLER